MLRIEPSPFGLVSPPALRSAGLPAPFRAWPRGSTSGFTRPAPNQPKPNILCPIAAAGTQHLVSCPFLAYGGVKGAHKAAARTARRFTRASRNGRRGRAQRPLMQPEADPNPLRQRTGSASPPALCRPARDRRGFLPHWAQRARLWFFRVAKMNGTRHQGIAGRGSACCCLVRS